MACVQISHSRADTASWLIGTSVKWRRWIIRLNGVPASMAFWIVGTYPTWKIWRACFIMQWISTWIYRRGTFRVLLTCPICLIMRTSFPGTFPPGLDRQRQPHKPICSSVLLLFRSLSPARARTTVHQVHVFVRVLRVKLCSRAFYFKWKKNRFWEFSQFCDYPGAYSWAQTIKSSETGCDHESDLFYSREIFISDEIKILNLPYRQNISSSHCAHSNKEEVFWSPRTTYLQPA